MKKGSILLLLLAYVCTATAQLPTLGVQGSSTANGVGASSTTGTWIGIPDSSWVVIVNKALKSQGLIDTTHKLAASTLDLYNGLWTGYTPPDGRNAPNTNYNCTRLLTRMPRVDIVIVAYPSTSYDVMPTREVIERYKDLKNFYNSQGIICYLLSTQPRDNFSLEHRMKLKHIKDTMMEVFGKFAIDVYSGIADPITYKRKPEFALANDQIHLNNAGHKYIAEQVLASNIIAAQSPLPIAFKNVKVKRINKEEVRVDFEVEDLEHRDKVYATFSLDGGKTYHRVLGIPVIPNKTYYAIIKTR